MQGWRVSQSPGFRAHRDHPAVVRLPSPVKGGKQHLVSLPILTSWGRQRQLIAEEEGGQVGQQVWEGGTSARFRHTDSPDRRGRGMRAGTSASGDTVLLPAEALKPDFRARCGGAGEIRESLWPSLGWLVSSLQFKFRKH